jgi:hypothetical protein
MDYTAIDIAGLAPNQKAFTLPGGAKAVVQIGATPKGANAWNAEPDSHLAVHVSTWQIDDVGAAVLVNGNKVGPPAKVHAVLTSALAEGTSNLPDVLTQATLDALGRLSNWLAAQPHVAALLAAGQQAISQQAAASQAAISQAALQAAAIAASAVAATNAVQAAVQPAA